MPITADQQRRIERTLGYAVTLTNDNDRSPVYLHDMYMSSNNADAILVPYTPHDPHTILKYWNKNPVKRKFKQSNSEARELMRNANRFDTYDFNAMGYLSAHANMNYFKEKTGYSKDTPLFGLEIEIDRTQSARMNERKFLGKLFQETLPKQHYICQDGTTNNEFGEGMEIVTAPRSESDIKRNYVNFYKLFKGLKEAGFSSHDRGKCGLHVHVSRDHITNPELVRMTKFIVKSQKLFKLISRRTTYNYCKFEENTGERYRAVNPTSYTIEFRFFRGTTRAETFFASLEMIFELVRFTKENAKLSPYKFLKHLKKSPSKFAYTYYLDKYKTCYPSAIPLVNTVTGEKYTKSEIVALRMAHRVERKNSMEAKYNKLMEGILSNLRPVISATSRPEDIELRPFEVIFSGVARGLKKIVEEKCKVIKIPTDKKLFSRRYGDATRMKIHLVTRRGLTQVFQTIF